MTKSTLIYFNIFPRFNRYKRFIMGYFLMPLHFLKTQMMMQISSLSWPFKIQKIYTNLSTRLIIILSVTIFILYVIICHHSYQRCDTLIRTGKYKENYTSFLVIKLSGATRYRTLDYFDFIVLWQVLSDEWRSIKYTKCFTKNIRQV